MRKNLTLGAKKTPADKKMVIANKPKINPFGKSDFKKNKIATKPIAKFRPRKVHDRTKLKLLRPNFESS